jgi:hypothetical protein
MSTDFFGSPLEISGRTPAYAPVTSAVVRDEPKNALHASSRYATSARSGGTWSSGPS